MYSREELKQKLRNKIKDKKNNTNLNNIQQLQKEAKQEMQDSGISMQLLNKYRTAITTFKNVKIATPFEVLANKDTYLKEYSNYVLIAIKEAKENKYNIETIKRMLTNSYTDYMTSMLNLPLLPSWLK